MTTSILSASLTITGLHITYTEGSLTLDPYGTCRALQTAGMIEGFELDGNNEPVILYTDEKNPQGYNGEPWHRFVKAFPFTTRYAEMVLEAREEREIADEFYSRIERLRVA